MGASRGSALSTFLNSWMASIEQGLLARRDERRISQTATAQMIGVSQPAITKLESGRAKNIELKTVARYAVPLGGRAGGGSPPVGRRGTIVLISIVSRKRGAGGPSDWKRSMPL